MLRLIFAPVAAAGAYLGTLAAWDLGITPTFFENGAHGLVHLTHLVTGIASPIVGCIAGWKLGKRLENGPTPPEPPAGPA